MTMQLVDNINLLILASKSPRREYLLKQAGLQFNVIPSQVDESTVPMTYPDTYVKILAEQKARDVAHQHPNSFVVGADTIVCIGDTVLGKPKSRNDAREMLNRLSGKTHQVLTGFAVYCENRSFNHSEKATWDRSSCGRRFIL